MFNLLVDFKGILALMAVVMTTPPGRNEFTGEFHTTRTNTMDIMISISPLLALPYVRKTFQTRVLLELQ